MVFNRRIMIVGAASAVVAGVPIAAPALTGIAALDTAAIKIKYPAGVLLEAVTLTPGNRLVAVGEHGVVVYSDDDGANWVQAEAVPVNVTLTCVEFATADIGWAAGHFGVILNTHNGGKNWRIQLNGMQVNQMALQSAEDPAVASNPSPAAAMALRRAQRLMSIGSANPFLTMLVFSMGELIVFGAYRMAVLSNDGGVTWQDWDLHIYDKFSHNIYDAVNIGGVYFLVGEEGLVFASTDDGNAFLPLARPGNTTLFGLIGPRDGSLVVFGVAGFAARSTDRGNSWTLLTIASEQDLTCGRVLDNGVVLLADEAGSMFHSTDNGVTYSRIQDIKPLPFFDVQQVPGGGLIAVGPLGVTQIAKSLLAS